MTTEVLLDDLIAKKNLQNFQYNSGKIFTLTKQQVNNFASKYSYVEYICKLHDGERLLKSVSVCHYWDNNDTECHSALTKSILDFFPELQP